MTLTADPGSLSLLQLKTKRHMPKAKTFRGQRLTKAVPSKRKRRKKDGRPKGTIKRYKFSETKLGFMLKYETPVEYDLIIEHTQGGEKGEPTVAIIETIASASTDPSFKKEKFKRYLDLYKAKGLYIGRAKKMTDERKVYYEKIRKTKLKMYIKANIHRISILREKYKLNIGAN